MFDYKLAVYLAKEVAAILRAVLTHENKKLYNDSTVHLLCSNYWIQPIYQELLHSSSRRNATRECERKRPSSGLARVTAYAKPPKLRRLSASGTSFRDWIGGTVKTTHERCGPFSLVVLSQRRGRVTTSSGPPLSETLSSKTLQVS